MALARVKPLVSVTTLLSLFQTGSVTYFATRDLEDFISGNGSDIVTGDLTVDGASEHQIKG